MHGIRSSRGVQRARVSEAYQPVHDLVPQTTADVLSEHKRQTPVLRPPPDDDIGAGMSFWPTDSPLHLARGSLRSRLHAPASIPESMPSVDSYEPSSLPASQDGVNQWDFAVGTPQSCVYPRWPTPPLSDTSNEGSTRDAQNRARCAAHAGVLMSSPSPALHMMGMPQAGASGEVYDAATPLRATKEIWSRRMGMQSTNRRKRRSSDTNAVSRTRSAELARAAALMVAAPGSSIHVENQHPLATLSGPLEDSFLGSISGSTRMSSRSEPITSNHKHNSSMGSSRMSSSSRARWAQKGLRTRLSGNQRAAHRRSVTSESDCSPRMLPSQPQSSTAAALVPPMTAVDGPLTLLPNCPVAQQHTSSNAPNIGQQHVRSTGDISDRLGTGNDAPNSDAAVPLRPEEYSIHIPSSVPPMAHVFTSTYTDSEPASIQAQQQPSLHDTKAGEWAAGELAGLNLGATASAQRGLRLHLPLTPRVSPRSPSPQRVCRRQMPTPRVTPRSKVPDGTRSPTDGRPLLTPRAAVDPGYESVYSGQPCARSRMAAAVSGRQHKEPEDSNAKKMQVAMQHFEMELRNRLVAHGVEERSPIETAMTTDEMISEHTPQVMSVRRHSGTPRVGPQVGYMQGRRLSERQFDDKDRLEEGTLSSLAACMHRRIT